MHKISVVENKIKKIFSKCISSKYFSILSSICLIAFYINFLLRHLEAYKNTGAIYLLLFACMESVVIVLFVIREMPELRSTEIIPHLAAFVGTFLPLTFNPVGSHAWEEGGIAFLYAGSCLAIIGYFSLNRSFGIGPAVRKIKKGGLYRFVRHPLYTSYFFIYVGYLLLSMTLYNLVLVVSAVCVQIVRAHFEENLLMQKEGYREYSKNVKWRFFPGLG